MICAKVIERESLKGDSGAHQQQRVVFDRNRATGGGVTKGIDFGFALMA